MKAQREAICQYSMEADGINVSTLNLAASPICILAEERE